MANKYIANTTGRRKKSIARVYLQDGKGKIVVNDKPMEEYFTIGVHQDILKRSLIAADSEKKFDVIVKVKGGGITGQAEACLHGLARALVLVDEKNKEAMKANGFLTRDARMVERKKYGQKKARKKVQFSKR